MLKEVIGSRDQERIINNKTQKDKADILFLKFSSDIGTIRNFGRRGSQFAPEAILTIVKKLCCHNLSKWSDIELALPADESLDFALAQKKVSNHLSEVINNYPRAQKFVYLGGGHDYIYPISMAINNFTKKIVIINLDAHLDTRTDKEPNSGTPFRQIDRDFLGEVEIIQLGIHDFANSITTMSNLDQAREIVATYEDIRFGTKEFTETDKFLERVIPFQAQTTYLFSLDADAIESAIMEGVSAVNHRGLPYDFIEDVLDYTKNRLNCQHFGFFEYNPVYDNLSQKGARALAALVYKVMDTEI